MRSMKRYTAAQARAQFSLLLDEAERGESVIIERRGVRFHVRTGRQAEVKPTTRAAILELVDPDVAAGHWTWDWDSEGVRFTPQVRGRR